MTGTRVVATLVFVATATAVIPPALAWTMHRGRVRRAAVDVASLAERLRGVEARLDRLGETVEVLGGTGKVPRALAESTRRWVDAPRGALVGALSDRQPVPIDPWGNCYLVRLPNAAAGRRAPLLVLSAGPDGIIDTPFFANAAEAAARNDIARSP